MILFFSIFGWIKTPAPLFLCSCSIYLVAGWLMLVGQPSMKSLLSVCPSVTKFSQNWIIRSLDHWIIFDIVHNSWPWYLVTDEARFLKKIWPPEFGPNRTKSGPKWGFLPFSWVWIISFPWNCIQWQLVTISNISYR